MSEINSSWTPTVENINNLPEPVRCYIHDLETNCDPARNLVEIEGLRQQRDALLAERAALVAVQEALAVQDKLILGANREIERLRKLIESGFKEGYRLGLPSNVPHVDFMLSTFWKASDTKAALAAATPPEQGEAEAADIPLRDFTGCLEGVDCSEVLQPAAARDFEAEARGIAETKIAGGFKFVFQYLDGTLEFLFTNPDGDSTDLNSPEGLAMVADSLRRGHTYDQ